MCMRVFGALLLLWGVGKLLANLGLWPSGWHHFGPVVMIVIGFALLVSRRPRSENHG